MNILEAEHSVIGSLLVDPAYAFPVIRGRLKADSFMFSTNRELFLSACKLFDEGESLDVVTIGNVANVSGDYLSELMTVVPTAANINAYIDVMINTNMHSRLETLSEDIRDRLIEATDTPQEICVHIQEEISAITEEQTSSDTVTSMDACIEFFDHLGYVQSGNAKASVRCGYVELDDILGGFANEGLYVLAARPGGGKTTLGLQIAERVAKRGVNTLFVSLEMSNKQLSARRVSVLTGISYGNVFGANLNEKELEQVASACSQLADRPLRLNRRRSASVEDISFMAHQIPNLGFLVIDYLGLIQNTTGRSLYEKTTDTSNKLKRLAMQLGIPILCLAQLNREVEGRADHRPRLSDLRDSGAIEQDADGVILLDGLTEEEREAGVADLTCYIAKNRHGALGKVAMRWYLNNGRIVGREV